MSRCFDPRASPCLGEYYSRQRRSAVREWKVGWFRLKLVWLMYSCRAANPLSRLVVTHCNKFSELFWVLRNGVNPHVGNVVPKLLGGTIAETPFPPFKQKNIFFLPPRWIIGFFVFFFLAGSPTGCESGRRCGTRRYSSRTAVARPM